MGYFNKDNRGGNRFGGNNSGGNRSNYGNRNSGRGGFGGGFGGREQRQMFEAICDNCGDKCEVPFRPTGEKEVFCSKCYSERGGSENRDDRRRGGQRESFGSDRNRERGGNNNAELLSQFAELNSKLDRIINALESKSKKPELKVEEKTETDADLKPKKTAEKKAAPKKTAKKVAPKKKTAK